MFVELLRRTIEKMPMPEPSFPKGRTAKIADDDPEQQEANSQASDTLSSALFIAYKNSKGEVSERRIAVKAIHRNTNDTIMISAYCYERRAFRTFRADRIIEAIDLATGEVIDTEDAILECFDIAATDIADDPRAATREALKKCRHVVNILTYLARCDGYFHQNEENVIIHYIVEQCFDYKFDDDYLISRIRGLYPDTDTFFDSLDYLEEKDPESLKKLARYAAQLVQADGEIVAAELDFMSELEGYVS